MCFKNTNQTLCATLAFLRRTLSQLVSLKNANSFSSSELVRKWNTHDPHSSSSLHPHTLIPRLLSSFSALEVQKEEESVFVFPCEHLKMFKKAIFHMLFNRLHIKRLVCMTVTSLPSTSLAGYCIARNF